MIALKGVKDRVRLKVLAEFEGDADNRALKVPFYCTYRKPKNSEAKALLDQIKADEAGDDEILRDWLVGWDGLKDADDQDIPYDDEALAEIAEITEYRVAIVEGFFVVLAGKKALRAKN